MRGRRCYDPAFEEELKQQWSHLTERHPSKSWREKPPETWSNRNVCDWLNYQGFDTMAPAMQRESLEGRDLRDLSTMSWHFDHLKKFSAKLFGCYRILRGTPITMSEASWRPAQNTENSPHLWHHDILRPQFPYRALWGLELSYDLGLNG